MERDLVEDIRANPFGADRPISENEREAQARVVELQRGNAFLAAWRHDASLEREIAREHR